MKRKREQLRENVIIAAREDMLSGGWRHQQVHDALKALDDYDAAELTGQGARWVEGSPETSQEAALKAAPLQFSTRSTIIHILAGEPGHGGYTDEMLEVRMQRKHQTVSSARNWLVEAGWVRDSGLRRKTRSNREAVVWELTPAAWRKWKEGI